VKHPFCGQNSGVLAAVKRWVLAILARERAGCAWLRAPSGPLSQGFDRAAFSGAAQASGHGVIGKNGRGTPR